MGCMEMSHSALAIYYKAVQATPQIPLLRDTMSKNPSLSQEKMMFDGALWVKAGGCPAGSVFGFGVNQAVMQAVGAFLPEFDRDRA